MDIPRVHWWEQDPVSTCCWELWKQGSTGAWIPVGWGLLGLGSSAGSNPNFGIKDKRIKSGQGRRRRDTAESDQESCQQQVGHPQTALPNFQPPRHQTSDFLVLLQTVIKIQQLWSSFPGNLVHKEEEKGTFSLKISDIRKIKMTFWFNYSLNIFKELWKTHSVFMEVFCLFVCFLMSKLNSASQNNF